MLHSRRLGVCVILSNMSMARRTGCVNETFSCYYYREVWMCAPLSWLPISSLASSDPFFSCDHYLPFHFVVAALFEIPISIYLFVFLSFFYLAGSCHARVAPCSSEVWFVACSRLISLHPNHKFAFIPLASSTSTASYLLPYI